MIGMDSSPFDRGIMCRREGLGFNKLNEEEADMDATTVAVDLAKDVFEVATANRAGRILERKRLTRRQFEAFVDALPVGTRVVMEACGTAHYWGRRCQAHGHDVRLLPVQYVKPYVRRNKTDRMDTEALLEAARCAGIHPVPVKTPEQQALQALHRVRTQWQRTRTARVNTLRGMLREHGIPMAVGARTVLTKMPRMLEDAGNGLPAQLTHGARAVLLTAQRTLRGKGQGTRLQQWAVAVAARRGHNKAAIAVANKLARVVWAVWRGERDFSGGPQLPIAA